MRIFSFDIFGLSNFPSIFKRVINRENRPQSTPAMTSNVNNGFIFNASNNSNSPIKTALRIAPHERHGIPV